MMGRQGCRSKLLISMIKYLCPWIDINSVGEPLQIYLVHGYFLEGGSSIIMFSIQRVQDLGKIKHHQCKQRDID